MNDDTSRSRRHGLPRRAALLTAATGVALLTAACGSSSSAPGTPGASSAGAGGSSPVRRPTTQQKQLAWSECMRSHGAVVPTSVPSPAPGGTGKAVKLSGPTVNPNSPRYRAAQQACESLQPGGTRAAG